MTSKTAQAKLAFEKPQRYLCRREYDIRVRRETVQELVEGRNFTRILDIGCGDGSISLPLLTDGRQLTLVDMSSSMLTLARAKVPAELVKHVELINYDFLTAPVDSATYDLILCIGVLAHVDSPDQIIAKIAKVLKPGGAVILEFTDSYHFWGRVDVLFQNLWQHFSPAAYRLNHLSRPQVLRMCRQYGLEASAVYRYAPPPAPGSHRLMAQETLYSLTRRLFGTARHNRNAWLGNEFIYRLE